jgi:hypothetical protein
MSLLSAFGTMGLVLGAIVLLCVAVTRMENTAQSSEYDERQQLVRGRGYRLSNIVGVVYMILILPVLIRQVEGEKTVEPYLLVYVGFWIQQLVFHSYCLINYAALPLSRKPVGSILGYLGSGIIWMFAFRDDQARWPFAPTGYGRGSLVYLISSFSFFALSLMHLIQFLRQRNSERTEEKE